MKTTIMILVLAAGFAGIQAQNLIIDNGQDIDYQLWIIAQQQAQANQIAAQQAQQQGNWFKCQACIQKEMANGMDSSTAMFLCQSQCQ